MADDLLKRLSRIGERVSIPCPDNIRGCLVFHYRVDTDPTCVEAIDEIKRLRAEVEEQARLNGMGVERELAAETEIKRLQKVLATYACRCGEGECYVEEFVPSCGRSAQAALGEDKK